jgi:hypothetical protein
VDIPILTVTGFEQMERQVKDAETLPGTVGMTVLLWRLQALVQGYRWALDHGYPQMVTHTEDHV